MLSKPSLHVCFADSETKGQFLEAYGVACILGVDTVDGVIHMINVDAFLLVFNAGHILV